MKDYKKQLKDYGVSVESLPDKLQKRLEEYDKNSETQAIEINPENVLSGRFVGTIRFVSNSNGFLRRIFPETYAIDVEKERSVFKVLRQRSKRILEDIGPDDGPGGGKSLDSQYSVVKDYDKIDSEEDKALQDEAEYIGQDTSPILRVYNPDNQICRKASNKSFDTFLRLKVYWPDDTLDNTAA